MKKKITVEILRRIINLGQDPGDPGSLELSSTVALFWIPIIMFVAYMVATREFGWLNGGN